MSTLLEKAGKKLFEKHLEQYSPQDPLYEVYTTDRGKQKRRKRAIPPGLSKRDARILKSLMSRAHYLDKGFSLFGMRFGWSFIIGLIPLVGDVADIGLSYILVTRPAQKLEIPVWLLRRMLVNNAVSAGVGFVPIVGDVFLGMFKANSRNVALIEEFLRIRGEEFIKMGGMPEDDENKGWFGRKKKAAPATAAISANDVEQVKPGAGMSGPEMKTKLGEPSTSAVASSQVGSKASKNLAKSGSSGFSLFGSRSKKSSTTPPTLPQPPLGGNQGRFIEDVDFQPNSTN